ncbi:hypothetical protein HDV06_003964 [Boothiomyces sp. JEL0866]|nr:hypothetical protein HDV06_003964 [Boothiomyces sp. JEL0866]
MNFISRQASPTQKLELSLKKSRSMEYKSGGKSIPDRAMSNVWDIIEKDPKIAKQYVTTATSVSRTKSKKSSKEPTDKPSPKKKELQKIEHKKETLYKLLEELQRESVNLKKTKTTIPVKTKPISKPPVKQKKTKKITKVPQVLPVIPKGVEQAPTKIPDYIASNSPLPTDGSIGLKLSDGQISLAEKAPENNTQNIPVKAEQFPKAAIELEQDLSIPQSSVSSKKKLEDNEGEPKSKIPRKRTITSDSKPLTPVSTITHESIFDSADPSILEFVANLQKATKLTRKFLNCIPKEEISLKDQDDVVQEASKSKIP